MNKFNDPIEAAVKPVLAGFTDELKSTDSKGREQSGFQWWVRPALLTILGAVCLLGLLAVVLGR